MTLAIDVKKLGKVYKGGTKALDNVDLSVEAGKIFALLGPNGAGKTTLMRILTTQLEPTQGEAYVFGINVVSDSERVRRLVSYIPQEMGVWTDISGYENLLIYSKIYGIPSSKRGKIIEEALESMGLTEFRNDLVNTYSGGMIRRLEIASAMLMKPKLLFLDEPTIGLDPSARKAVWENLTSFKIEYGATVFFNTHYMDEAEHYSDEIAIIDRGVIVKRGTVRDLEHSVGGEVILLSLEKSDLKGSFQEKMGRVNGVREVIVGDSEITIIVEDAETALPRVMEVSRLENVSVKRISVTKSSLDDVFLKYAGSRLESGGRMSEVKQVRSIIRRG